MQAGRAAFSIVFILALSACSREDAARARSSQGATDRVERSLDRAAPAEWERLDGGDILLGPVSSEQEAALRKAFDIADAESSPPRPKVSIDELRERVTNSKTPAEKARRRLELANQLLEDGRESEALEQYRTVAVLDWKAIGDGELDPTLPARLVLRKQGEWSGSPSSGSLTPRPSSSTR